MIRSESSGVPHRVTFTNGEITADADVPKIKGGTGHGFGPHELVEAALATCMAISVEMYAAKHAIPLESVAVEVRLDRSRPTEVALVPDATDPAPTAVAEFAVAWAFVPSAVV